MLRRCWLLRRWLSVQVNFLRDSRLIALFPNTKMDTPSYMTGWEDAIVNHLFILVRILRALVYPHRLYSLPAKYKAEHFLLASKHTRGGVCTKGKQRRCVFYGRCFSSMQISRRLFWLISLHTRRVHKFAGRMLRKCRKNKYTPAHWSTDDFLMALVVKLDVWPAIILFYASKYSKFY